MGLNRFIKRYGTIVMAVVAFVFVVGGVVSGLGGALGRGGANAAAQAGAAASAREEAVATVGGEKVTRARVEREADQAEEQQRQMAQMMGQPVPPPDPAQRDAKLAAALDGPIKQQEALVAAAKTAGVTVTDADIAAARDKMFSSQRAQFAEQLKLKADASDSELDSALGKVQPGLTLEGLKAEVVPDYRARVAAYYDKLDAKFRGETKPTDDAVKRSLSDVTVRHILVKFGTGALPEAQARAKAEKILAEVKATPAKMGDLAKQFSDDPGSKDKGGVYDWTPAQAQGIVPEFASALDKLQPGQTYPELVRHADPQPGPGYQGFHIIRLEAVKQGKDFPKDFDKEKAKYAGQFAEQYAQRRLQQALQTATADVKVDVTDPGIKAALLVREAGALPPTDKTREAKLTEAVAFLDKVDKKDDVYGAVPVRKAQILEQLNKKPEAIAAYKEALAQRNVPETRLALASLLVAQKDTAGAKEQLAEAEKLALPSPQLAFQMSQLYSQLGDKAKAAAMMQKANDMFKRMQEAQAPPPQISLAPSPAPAASGSPAPAATPSAAAPSPAASR
jgi:parvulin-like peptidyl-prolyl isomerase